MTQSNDAAERETVGPCVEVAPGVWRLRVLVEAEAEIARLRAEVEAMRGAFCVSCRRAGRADNAVAYPCTCDDPPCGMTGLEYRGG